MEESDTVPGPGKENITKVNVIYISSEFQVGAYFSLYMWRNIEKFFHTKLERKKVMEYSSNSF